ncbi:MAG: radical SAM protein [Planctomycetaceae bacterium]|jgi:radical SAM protein with 4Fe4S-binding SPASM domain|nr:radical SAM protein [Planctomycetaceae bacterium]
MAEYKIKANTQRIPLQDHIPLNTPLRVFLETSSICNFRCYFCPHGVSSVNNAMINMIMPFELAKKCIDDIKLFPQKIKLLTLSTVGEPLLNKKLPEIVAYAKQSNIADNIDLVTNASLMTHDTADQLIASGIDRIDISIYGLSKQQYEKNSSVKINFEEFVNNIRYLYQNKKQCTIVIKICDAALKEENDEQRFYTFFSDICDRISVESIVPIWYGLEYDFQRVDASQNIYGKQRITKNICPPSFFSLEIHANGKVSPCCQDWKHLLIIGDAKTESLHQIWTGDKNYHHRILQLKQGRSTIPACADCQYPETVVIDNIDPYREMILRRFEERKI